MNREAKCGWKVNELDFRFADEEDAEDIKSLINSVYVHEEEGKGGFRPDGDPKINISEIIDDLESASIRWLLLETPRPEEAVIAALRLRIKRRPTESSGKVDLFGSLEPHGQRAVCNMLLNRAETVCKSLGCQKLIFEIPHWSEDRLSWLENCGYRDLGGHEWPEDRQDEIIRHTMVLMLEKPLMEEIQIPSVLTPPNRSIMQSINIPPIPSPHITEVSQDIHIVTADDTCSSGTDNSDPMFPLIKDLFSALHAESNIESSNEALEKGMTVTQSETSEFTVHNSGGTLEYNGSNVSSSALEENSDMVNLIGDLFSALHSELNDISDSVREDVRASTQH